MKNTDNIKEQLSLESDMTVPVSTPPNIESLNQRVEKLRGRRRTMRRGASLAAIVSVFAGSIAVFHHSGQPDTVSAASQPISAVVVNAPSTNARDNANNDDEVTRSDASPAAPLRSEPRIRLYARVRLPQPVFGVDEETQSVHHVGWVESEESVPMDMNYVPVEQQETFNAVLTGMQGI